MKIKQHPLGNVYISLLNDFVEQFPVIRPDMVLSMNLFLNRITMTQCHIKQCTNSSVIFNFSITKNGIEYIFQTTFKQNEWSITGMTRQFSIDAPLSFYEPFNVNCYCKYFHLIMFDLKYYMEDILPVSFKKDSVLY
jgi:hypothetical protein